MSKVKMEFKALTRNPSADSVFFPNVSFQAALDQFTKCTALELIGKGVRVNSLNPGESYAGRYLFFK